MLRLAAIFVFFFLGACFATDHISTYNNMQNIDDYGNWCGGGHGGYQDCCNGGKCSACDPGALIVSQACLDQCPPIDGVDLACAWHDLCCFRNEKPISCIPQGNWCACDCGLVEDVVAAQDTCPDWYCSAYAETLQMTFNTALSCWWQNSGAAADCGANISNICDHGRWP